jgi:magnesium chelatase family protein
VNLAPGNEPKNGTAFDLPIALGVLVATGQLAPDAVAGLVALGELGLDGSLRAVRGVLPVAIHAARRESGATGAVSAFVVPAGNADEARLVGGLPVSTPPTLGALVAALRLSPTARTQALSSWDVDRMTLDAEGETIDRPMVGLQPSHESIDLADVAGQETAKRALEIAAAGGHALLMVGPPGAGKTMLARRLPTILPPLSDSEALEVLAIQSVAGVLASVGMRTVHRPFRAPHHTLSVAALIGGGSIPRPGEVSLAHHGVLFLDELQEMPRSMLDALRQPMEDGRVLISRAQQAVVFPARFALVGAMNPCPCGHAGDPARPCTCAPRDVARHRARVSGPLADRIDMTIQVPAVALSALNGAREGESSSAVRSRVVAARERQCARYRRLRRVTCNAHVPGRWLDVNSILTLDGRSLLSSAADRLRLSARGYHRVLKVARTIADLDDATEIGRAHIAEALFFRSPEYLPVPDVLA